MLKWLKLRKSGFWGGFIILIRTLGGLGMQKFVAILYGPAGTTLLSHFQNLISLFNQPIQDTVVQGFINAYPKDSFSKNKLMATAIGFTILIFLSTLFLLWILKAFPTDLFNFSSQNWGFILMAILFLCLQGIASAVLIAKQKLKLLGVLQLLQWIIIFTFLFILSGGIEETLQYYLYIQGMFTFIFIGVLYRDLLTFLPLSFTQDKEILNHFKQFLWMALAVWISSKWVDFFIREYAINLFGSTETGYWQSIVRISEAYRALFVSFLFLTFYPVISRLYHKSRDKMKVHFRKQVKILGFFTALFFILVFVFRAPIITMLYSSEYLQATPLFKFQILGDILAFASFPFALMLMVSVQTKKYILCELLSAFIFIIYIFAGNSIGIEILVYAHILRFVFYFTLVVFFTRKNWSFA
ncbi:hypothetical protein JKA74_02140 [Marivirga sp. S37H4]|uniref:Polysaccharide biosynthesis protein n=1 Tax=Marivirga aurantiaca TaxID=2802615 RepID=A0A934WVN9_9BACT|nr:hypothetical protein [Marivirga aurantiaca]MBK6263822.1 hypothetical protein [Marivirga aurantiaca]